MARVADHDLGGGNRMTCGDTLSDVWDGCTPSVVMRPLKSNIADFPGALLTTCAECGAECWKTDREPDPLPVGIIAACTKCALLIGTGRRRPKQSMGGSTEGSANA
jgi:hypothetical protein